MTTIDGEIVEEPDMKLIESDRSAGPNGQDDGASNGPRAPGPMGLKKRTDRPMPSAGAAQRNVMHEIEETRRIAQREMGLILPSVEAVIPPQEFVWDRAKLYPKQEAAIFERKRISVIEASTKSGKTDPACSMVGGVTSARSA